MTLSGRLPEALEREGVVFDAGLVVARLDFVGGPVPAIEAAAVDASRVAYVGREGLTLAAGPHGAALDGQAVPSVRIDQVLMGLLDHLHDLSVEVAADTDRDLLVKISQGVEATLPASEVVTVRGCMAGPPDQPQLSAALVVSVAGTGVRLSHAKARWLSSLARVRLQEARLHPDGRVALHANTRGGAHRLGGGLQRVSERLSEVVRKSPRFARVRAFLKESDGY